MATAGSQDPQGSDQSSPWQAFEAKLEQVQKEQNTEGIIMLRGACDPDSDGEGGEDGSEKPKESFTEEQIANVRLVLATDEREAALKDCEKRILGSQYGDGLLMFNTRFSYEVEDVLYQFHQMFDRWPLKKQFNMLFAMTYTLLRYDTWLDDHEEGWGGIDEVNQIARRWKTILRKSDAELGIDGAFTRPGALHLLRQIKSRMEGSDECELFEEWMDF